mmetsp:Transcript_14901/g.21999  ORF Transcript_14901/g.21999 Transcript_14901/m.21999 type:complete len:170 (-) Transcript_14901:326-835(-)
MKHLFRGLNQQQEDAILPPVEDDLCPALTFPERVVGCLGCMLIGYVLSFGAFFRFTKLLEGDVAPFIVIWTLGNVVSLCGSCFLFGPKSQCDQMFHATRRIAAFVYLASMLTTIILAALFHDSHVGTFLLLVMMIVQLVAVAWYNLSYVPFARRWVKDLARKQFYEEIV